MEQYSTDIPQQEAGENNDLRQTLSLMMANAATRLAELRDETSAREDEIKSESSDAILEKLEEYGVRHYDRAEISHNDVGRILTRALLKHQAWRDSLRSQIEYNDQKGVSIKDGIEEYDDRRYDPLSDLTCRVARDNIREVISNSLLSSKHELRERLKRELEASDGGPGLKTIAQSDNPTQHLQQYIQYISPEEYKLLQRTNTQLVVRRGVRRYIEETDSWGRLHRDEVGSYSCDEIAVRARLPELSTITDEELRALAAVSPEVRNDIQMKHLKHELAHRIMVWSNTTRDDIRAAVHDEKNHDITDHPIQGHFTLQHAELIIRDFVPDDPEHNRQLIVNLLAGTPLEGNEALVNALKLDVDTGYNHANLTLDIQ